MIALTIPGVSVITNKLRKKYEIKINKKKIKLTSKSTEKNEIINSVTK